VNGNQFFGVKLAFDLLATQVLEFEHGARGSVHDITYLEYFGGVILFSAFREFHLFLADAYFFRPPEILVCLNVSSVGLPPHPIPDR
jgi:hypothetical protein